MGSYIKDDLEFQKMSTDSMHGADKDNFNNFKYKG